MNKNQLNYMANIIRQKRKDLGYSQDKFSEIIGITYSAYSKIENSTNQPSVDTLIKIATHLHISLDELLLGYQNKEIKNEIDKLKDNPIISAINSSSIKDIEAIQNILTQLIAIKKSN